MNIIHMHKHKLNRNTINIIDSWTILLSFCRLVAETDHLENEKAQKEAEVQKLIEENVRLRALLDNKESQLLAMNEQYKWMLLNNPGI